jgi:hypothetical protein
MAKERKSQSETKANPLGAIGRRPGSYVGDLDSLLAEVEDTALPSPPASEGQRPEGAAPERNSDREERPAERTKPRMKRINLDVPSDLHQRFKGVTGMAGRTMTDVVQELIREYLDRTTT